ncbi:MAG TPA: hypothetical protein VFE48_07445 [Methylomirabilota bacterium]|nr:hypothetical protein [Methylomirabilota bacterium]
MSGSGAASDPLAHLGLDAGDFDAVIRAVRFELYRENIYAQKIPGAWEHGELPSGFEPIEFGSFFVSYAK